MAQVFIVGMDERIINITNHPADDVNPKWSPDGKRIAFYQIEMGRSLRGVMGLAIIVHQLFMQILMVLT
jgi:Tol biopolymer transport system component